MESIHISIIRFTGKKLSDGSNPLLLRVHFGGTNRRKHYTLSSFNKGDQKLTAIKREWIVESSRYKKKKDPRNEILFDIETRVADFKKDIKDKNKTFSLDGLEKAVFTIADTSSFTGLIEAQIKALDDTNRFSYANSYRNVKSAVNDYADNRDLGISDITKEWLGQFDWHMQEKGYTKNTRGIYMRNLRRIFNIAIEKGFVNSSQYPFGTNGFEIGTSTATKRALTKEHMLAMINAELPMEMRNSQNYFALSYLGGGINFKDMALWRWDDNIVNKRIIYYRSKTRRKVKQQPQSIPLGGRIAEILSEYTETPGYVLPVVFSENPKTIRHQILRALRKTNKELKEIARMAKVPNPDQITFYVARHTFATVLKKKGHSVEKIKELLGHEDIKTTQIYLGSFDDATKDAAFEDLV